MNKIEQVNTKLGFIGILCLLVFSVWIIQAEAITWG
jgi:hypothetical protein